MIFGIGIDSVEIERLERSIKKELFMERVFSPEENAYFSTKNENKSLESAAASFAAKEAFLKAAGVGIGGFALYEITTLHKESGAPYLLLSGGAAAFCKKNKLSPHLSLTHEAGVATAIVVLEQEKVLFANL